MLLTRACTRQKLLPFIFVIGLAAAACSSAPSLREYSTTLRCPDCLAMGVARIIDGDTFDSPGGRVRLFGVDTPERGERCRNQAGSGLKQLAGGLVRVEPGPRAKDPGGRLLYYVYTEAGNSNDEILVREGLARAWTRDGQHRHHLAALEREARARSAGCLW